ncbi:unnamed protein product [Peronospora destructor]|uniref:Transmembrane protein n=1 Tax=Peronospora destructor TaxID=86335 RepID=A0AAV0ULG4_9STRA|nr:unnamed protein product [Peronospora destructor]
MRDSGLHWIDLELLLDLCLAASLLICVVVWTILYPYAVKTGHPEKILNGPYPFFELDTPWAPLWYGGLLVAHVMALILVMLLSKVKQKKQQSMTFANHVEA